MRGQWQITGFNSDINTAWCERCCRTNDFEDLIDEAPTVPLPDFKAGYRQAVLDGKTNYSRPKGKWIPVSERLPEEANKSYLVTVKYGDDIICSCQRFFFGEGIGWNDDCVVAWQPLPKPYKEGDEE